MNALLADTDPRRFSSPPAARSLHDAVAEGDAAAVRALLSKGANLEERDSDGCTPLLSACKRLQAQASSDRPSKAPGERLAVAEACALALIEAHASANAADAEGRTPLMFALGSGSPRVARALLALHAQPFARDAAWQSSFFYAIGIANARRASELVHPACEGLAALLEAAAPILSKARFGRGASDRRDSPLDEMDCWGAFGLPPLARAAMLDDARSCALLLAAGADPDLPIGNGESSFAGRTPRELAKGEAAHAFTRHAEEQSRRFAEEKAAELFRSLGVKSFAH